MSKASMFFDDISFWLIIENTVVWVHLQVLDFVIMDDDLVDELEKFHDWDRGHSWIPYNVLVRYWKETDISIYNQKIRKRVHQVNQY